MEYLYYQQRTPQKMTKEDSDKIKTYSNEHPKGKKPSELNSKELEKNIFLQGGANLEIIGMSKEEKKEYKKKRKQELKDFGILK